MELSRQQHAELAQMAQYFGRIEEIADRMGVELDTLVEESNLKNPMLYPHFKKSILAMTQNRRDTFKNYKGRDPEEAIIANFSVIVNEDRFLD